MKRCFLVLGLVAMALQPLSTPCLAQVFTTLDDPLATGSSGIYGIDGNNIVGAYTDATGGHGFLYNGSTFTTLNDPLAGPRATSATGISGGNIVGGYRDANNIEHGYVYNNGTYTTLDDPLGTGGTYVTGVSANNVVGYYLDANGLHGFLDQNGIFTNPSVPSALTTIVSGISGNNLVGTAVFQGYLNGQPYQYNEGYLYNGSTYQFFSFPLSNTDAFGVSGNQVVGDFSSISGSNESGFFSNGSTLTPLSDPLGVNGTQAYGISGNTIVGTYNDSNNVLHGFVLTESSVPEPSSVVLFGLGLGVAGLVLRLRASKGFLR